MAARSESKATAAIQQINDLKLPGSVHWLKLELSDSRNAQASARDFLEKEKRLDILGELSFRPPERYNDNICITCSQ